MQHQAQNIKRICSCLIILFVDGGEGMDSINNIQRAIDFMEDNILGDLNFEIIASQAFMTSFHFQRIFSVLFGISLGEYIRNRRLTLAGKEIISSDTKIIDIAYKYGYETPEGFSRAFARFHNVSPMVARSRGTINSFTKISIQSILGGIRTMERLRARGYSVKENGTVYYTMDMDKTAKWFEDVLGWYGGIDQRNEAGLGTYGCLLPMPGELVNLKVTEFNGIHMFLGEPTSQTVAFMRVDNIDNLYSYVKRSGWQHISEIKKQHWGGRECDVTTIDGSVMRFFEVD